MNVEIHALAQREIRSAYRWYRRQSHRAALRFLAAVDATVAKCVANPTMWPFVLDQFRHLKTGRFPYALIYFQHDAKTIRIVAVAHGSRRPFYWRRRGANWR